jgi:hypothetical protein
MKHMKKIFLPIVLLACTLGVVQAQNDTLYIMRLGQVISKHKVAEVDSIIFYKPIVTKPDPGSISVSSGYFIGNSLTQDLNNDFPSMASKYQATLGKTYTWGSHFRASTPLTFFYLYPNDATSKATPSIWPIALPGSHWDVVTMQPYSDSQGAPNSLKDNIKAANGIIAKTKLNASNESTRFFIYSAWPQTSATDLNYSSNLFIASTIVKSAPGGTMCSLARDFVELLCDSVRKTNPGVCMIPVGEVFYKLDMLMHQGKFNSLTSINQFHRDVYHLNSAGINVAGWTAYATFFKKSPEGLSYDKIDISWAVTAPFLDQHITDAHDLLLIQQTIWEVVTEKANYTRVSVD